MATLRYDTVTYDKSNRPLHFFMEYWEDTKINNGLESMRIFYYYDNNSTGKPAGSLWNKIIFGAFYWHAHWLVVSIFAIRRLKLR